MNKDKFLTIPNIITLYRLLAFPVILYFIVTEKERLFAIFLIINLFTDIIDGYIARRFKMETEIGARLDSFADNLTYVLAFAGCFVFKLEDLRPHLTGMVIFISFLVLTVVISLLKFRKFPSFHLYTTKIGGYIEGAFIVILFTFGFFAPLFYLMIFWGIIGAIEHIAIQIIIPEMRSNVKGLYWVLKEKKSENNQ
jgi:CDP-diacylglycerol--glycerol-3-phosphate 3-phosphatidyltransferase